MKEVLYEKEHKKNWYLYYLHPHGSRHAGRMRFRQRKWKHGRQQKQLRSFRHIGRQPECRHFGACRSDDVSDRRPYPGFDEVYAKINEILEEKLNCSLNVEFLSWGEHDTKYSLLFSSQEDFDLIFTASSWCHYEQTVSLGGFAPLSEDFIKAYAPDIWEVVPEMAWEQAKIDGQIYMVPNYANEFGQEVLAVRGD